MKKDSNWHQTDAHPMVARLEKWGRKLFYNIVSFGDTILNSSELSMVSPSPSLTSIQKLLLIKEPYRMGDLFQITPILRALKTEFPHLKIGLVIQDRNVSVFKNNPYVDDLFLYKKREINHAPWKIFNFLSQIRSKHYEMAVTLETERVHLTNDLIALLSKAPIRIRYDGLYLGDSVSNAFYNLLIPFDQSLIHEVDKNYSVLKSLGLKLKDRSLQFTCSLLELEKAENTIKRIREKEGTPPNSKRVLIHPGSYKLENRWPLKNYIEVGNTLRKKGILVLFSLGPSEQEWKEEIDPYGFSILTNLNLGETGAVMKSCDLVLSNDTGMMHLASACGIKTIALFGKTDPNRWKPPGENTIALQSEDKNISSIKLEKVIEPILEKFR